MSGLADFSKMVVNPGGIFGDVGDFLSDPLDIFGQRAGAAQSEIEQILTQSAQAGISLNESQLARIEELTAPFRQAATDVALPNLSALAFGGDVDFQPSQLFGRQLEQGRKGILTSQTGAGPGLKSSNTFERLADLVGGLASEDVGRFEQGQLSLLQSGLGSEQALNQAGTTLTGNIAGLQSNLGQGLNISQQNLGQAKQASLQGLSSGLSGLAQFLVAR